MSRTLSDRSLRPLHDSATRLIDITRGSFFVVDGIETI